jgi:tetratricopeptide (TPR) repeat protein
MNYCGKCGTANGSKAYFCRQCGAELNNQSKLVFPSAPLDVEFAAKSNMLEPQNEASRSVSDPSAPTLIDPENLPPISSHNDENSGPLEMIVPLQPQMPPPPPPAPQVMLAIQPEMPQHAPRRMTTPMVPTGIDPRSGPSPGVIQFPVNGPSVVLAQASGLNPKPTFGWKLITGLIIIALLLCSTLYLAMRDHILTASSGSANEERDLVPVEVQSSQFIQVGERLREGGQYESALDNFQRALVLTPNNPKPHFLIAQTYSSIGLTDEALKHYKSLLRIAPEHLEARLQTAQLFNMKGNWNAAYQEFQRIIALDQNSVQAALALEAIETHQREQAEQTVVPKPAANKRKVVPKMPVLPSGKLATAQVSSLLPRKPVAEGSLTPPDRLNQNKSEESPDPRVVAETRKNIGLRYFAIGEFRAAINEFLPLVLITPEDKDLYYFIGSAYFGLGEPARAHEYYRLVNSGQYVAVAQSQAKKTEKAARDELKRRMNMLKN